MGVPATSIKLNADIYGTANGGSAPGTVSLKDVAGGQYDVFDGGSKGYNGWGQDAGNGGVNRIYGLSAKTTGFAMDDFAGLEYYYDNSAYKIAAQLNNSLAVATPPNPPNDVDVSVEFYSYNLSQLYASNISSANEGGGSSNFDVTNGTGGEPILATGYWQVVVTLNGAVGGNCTITINGNVKANSVAVGTGPNTLDYLTYGAEAAAATGGGFIGFQVQVDVF